MLPSCLELFSVGFYLREGLMQWFCSWNTVSCLFFLAEVKIWICSTLGATKCSPRSVDIVLLNLLSLSHLLFISSIGNSSAPVALFLHLFLAEISSLCISSPLVPVYVFVPGSAYMCLGPPCRDPLCIPSIF